MRQASSERLFVENSWTTTTLGALLTNFESPLRPGNALGVPLSRDVEGSESVNQKVGAWEQNSSPDLAHLDTRYVVVSSAGRVWMSEAPVALSEF